MTRASTYFCSRSDEPKGQSVTDPVSPGQAVRAELEAMPEVVSGSALAASAVALADRMATASDRDAAAIARELRTTMTELRARAEKAPTEVDPLDELANRRATRRTGDGKPDAAVSDGS